jgi:hypothetical protein
VAWMSVCCECCVSSGRDLCDELITSPEKSNRVWCGVVYPLEAAWMRRPWPTGGGGGLWLRRQKKKEMEIRLPGRTALPQSVKFYKCRSDGVVNVCNMHVMSCSISLSRRSAVVTPEAIIQHKTVLQLSHKSALRNKSPIFFISLRLAVLLKAR